MLGVAVAAVPLVLAVFGPLGAGARPSATVVVAAGVVTTGAAVVQGAGRTDGAGVLWAALVLLTEAAFTLLAVPVLARLGAWSLSLHASWLAGVGLVVLSVAVEGPDAVALGDRMPRSRPMGRHRSRRGRTRPRAVQARCGSERLHGSGSVSQLAGLARWET